jgi:hypothetical protein
VCAECHDASGNGAATIKRFRDGGDGLDAALTAAEAVVDRAEDAGMLVEDARLAVREAREQHVQLRVAMHTFTDEPFAGIAAKGLEAARRAEGAGLAALEELQNRRRGLAVATVLIVGFLATLWVKIRRLPAPAGD